MPVIVVLVPAVVIMCLLLFYFIRFFATAVYDFDVIIKDRGYDRDHVCLHYPSPHVLCSSDADIDNTLKGEIPLPYAHHISISPFFEDTDQTFYTSIDGQNIANTCGGCCEIRKVIKGVDKR